MIMTRTFLLRTGAALALAAATAGCGGDDAAPVAVVPPPPPVAVVPPPPPPPTPPPAQMGLSLTKCLNQDVAGRKLVDILVPDLLFLDLSKPAGFPNGRDFDDPVIDIELAALFLDLTVHPATTLVTARLNPDNFDQPLRSTFPFYAGPLGNPTLSPTTGTDFNFRLDPPGNYVRVDRMGLPAVSTAVVLGANKLLYNDSSPTADAAGTNVPRILEGYQDLTNRLNDDFKGLGLTPCAT
jgi:Domain of unknown function (DUF4331)